MHTSVVTAEHSLAGHLEGWDLTCTLGGPLTMLPALPSVCPPCLHWNCRCLPMPGGQHTDPHDQTCQRPGLLLCIIWPAVCQACRPGVQELRPRASELVITNRGMSSACAVLHSSDRVATSDSSVAEHRALGLVRVGTGVMPGLLHDLLWILVGYTCRMGHVLAVKYCRPEPLVRLSLVLGSCPVGFTLPEI